MNLKNLPPGCKAFTINGRLIIAPTAREAARIARQTPKVGR